MFKFSVLFFILFSIVASKTVWADKTYRLGSYSFDLAAEWACHKEEQSLSCQLLAGQGKQHTLLVLTLQQGSAEALKKLQSHFATSIRRDGVSGVYQSKLYHQKLTNLGTAQWFDYLHYGSELKNYFTRYFLTLQGQDLLLFSVSIHKDSYSKVMPQLEVFLKTFQSGGSTLSGAGGGSGSYLFYFFLLVIIGLGLAGLFWWKKKK